MKRQAIRHPKIEALAKTLRIPRLHALGIVIQMWDVAAERSPGGDIGALSNAFIANCCDMGDRADDLISAMVQVGLLDACSKHRLVVHDWKQHCPNWVRAACKLKGIEFVAASSQRQETQPTAPPAKPPASERPEPRPQPPPEQPAKQMPPKPTRASVMQQKPRTGGRVVTMPEVARHGAEMKREWNEKAAQHRQLNEVMYFSEARRTKLDDAFVERPDFRQLWTLALSKLPIASGPKGWQPSFDWTLDVNNVCKLLEGNFDHTKQKQEPPTFF